MVLRPLARALLFSVPLTLVPMLGRAQAPLGEVHSSDATVKGAVTVSASSTRLMSGSSVKAGVSNASVRLLRGGELRVCQGSTVSLTASANGSQLMVGMSSGTIEMHYPLVNSRDSVMTPDFEVGLVGSGVFHLAVSTDQNGNTCVQSLHGNTGSVTVSELMGDGSYTVKPGEQAFFRAGHAGSPGPVVGNCGCPAPVLVESAAAEPPVTPTVAAPAPPVAAAIGPSAGSTSVTTPPPAVPPESVHVQVEAPFVFRASELPPAPDSRMEMELAQVRLSTLPVLGSAYPRPPLQETAQAASPENAKPKKKRHGLWGFLASMFKG